MEEFDIPVQVADLKRYFDTVLLPRGILAHQLRSSSEECVTIEALSMACSVLTEAEVNLLIQLVNYFVVSSVC